ncbi:MAG: endonuclease/exonuclease/phosphatase family protein [Victivallaceae bacterium]
MGNAIKFLFSCVLICCSTAYTAAEVAPCETITVMSYNIWYTFNRQKQFEAAGHWLEEADADVLGLQEVCYADEATFRQWAKSWGYDYAEILKPGSMSIALCAKKPIAVIKKQTEGMHHGLMLCKIDGIHYLVTHLSPFKYEQRRLETEIIADMLAPLVEKGEMVVVMGDFNTPSPFDADHVNGNSHLLNAYADTDNRHPDYVKNLEDGKYEFKAFQTLLDLPLADAGIIPRATSTVDTYPTKAGIPDPEERMRQSYRIDFILLSRNLQERLESFETIIIPETDSFSDHYPIKAVLKKP